jgi:hypothetical protein
MAQDLYDLERIVARAEDWDLLAQVATMPEMRAFCLEEARLCAETVQRSCLQQP